MEEKKQKFLEALAHGYGIIATACEAIGIGRSTYYRWYNADPEFKEKVDEITETQVDFVESKLMQSINANDTTAIIFYLKTKGKKRGYSDKTQPKTADPLPVSQTLPEPSTEEDNKKIAAKIKSKKAYIVKLLKKQGKYTAELTYQVDITAKLLVRADILGDEIMADGHQAVNVEYSRPRKFSKTTSCAALAVYDMLFGDNNAQAYVGANSYDQAKICFDEIRNIMFDIDPKEKHFRVNREKITFKDRGRDSLIQCLTANAKTKDGLFASLVIMDEYAQARNTAGKNGADLKNVLTTSMGPRREPLTIIITTASDVVDGPFAHELDGVMAVLRGEAESDTMFASIFMPDVDDAEDSPETWAKVQPHLGITVQPDYYENEYQTAQLSAENMLAFRTKLLNIFTINDEKTWFTHEKAKELLGNFCIDQVQGRPDCAVAFDLSVHDDFSAVSYTVYLSGNKKFYTHTDYYFPEGALKGHPNEQLYRLWNEKGYLIFCKGQKIDTAMITEDILRRSKLVNIIRIGYDAYKAQELTSILKSVGARNVLTPFSQTYGNFNLPVESFEMLAWSDPVKIEFNDNPINAFCLENCVIDTDNLENKKPLKVSQYRKIDGAITLLMTLGLLYTYER